MWPWNQPRREEAVVGPAAAKGAADDDEAAAPPPGPLASRERPGKAPPSRSLRPDPWPWPLMAPGPPREETGRDGSAPILTNGGNKGKK